MISEQALSVLSALNDNAAVKAALSELCADQIKIQTDQMRGYVQAGDIGNAQAAEGAIRAFEDLSGTIANYAKQYKPERY